MFNLLFFFNDTATTEIYTLSLHDALPISRHVRHALHAVRPAGAPPVHADQRERAQRSEEHTSELQSRLHLVCRLLLEKKKTISNQAAALSMHSIDTNHISAQHSTTTHPHT